MANARLARFITEVAPPQIVSVMRHRTAKVLDTITEEEREYDSLKYAGSNESLNSSPKGSSSSASASSPSSPSFATAAARTDARYFLKGVHRSLSMFRCQ